MPVASGWTCDERLVKAVVGVPAAETLARDCERHQTEYYGIGIATFVPTPTNDAITTP